MGKVLLVETSNFKQTRNQKYFIQMSLRDRTAAIRAIRWEASRELYASFGEGDFVRIQGRVEEFQGHPQLIVDALERLDSDRVDVSEFLPTTSRSIDEMEQELDAAVDEIANANLRTLLTAIVRDPKIRAGLQRCPAGKALHHAYIGGLLEHIVSLIAAARQLTEHYRQLDRDILYAAAILHDIGKIDELAYERNFGYTDAGQLVGHIGGGLILVHDKAREVGDVPPDLLLELEHIIASHHGVPEYGALKLPMTPEAIAFHYLDNLDAKLASLDAMKAELPPLENSGPPAPTGRWSDYKPHLSRKIYFPRRSDG